MRKILASSLLFALVGCGIARFNIYFQEHFIDSLEYPYGVSAHDFNGDGLQDVIAPDVSNTTNTDPEYSALYLYMANKQGGYDKSVLAENIPGFLEHHRIADMNGDGKDDVIIVNNRDGEVYIFENILPATGKWPQRIVSTDLPRAYDVAIDDFDGDGDTDIAATGYTKGDVKIFANPGDWSFPWDGYAIAKGLVEVRSVRAADFDGDGKTDIMVTVAGDPQVTLQPGQPDLDSAVLWYKNPGRLPQNTTCSVLLTACAGRWNKNVVEAPSFAPMHGNAKDMDGDGDIDLVVAFGGRPGLVTEQDNGVAWFENRLNEHNAPWVKHEIGQLTSAMDADMADLDGDGDIDVVAGSHMGGNTVMVYENTGDEQQPWRARELRHSLTAVNQIILLDMDGDGRTDVLAAADNGNGAPRQKGGSEVVWWKNIQLSDE